MPSLKLKCLKCGKKAAGRFTPDLDVKGVGFCSRHKVEIWFDLWIATEEKQGGRYFEEKYFGKRKMRRA